MSHTPGPWIAVIPEEERWCADENGEKSNITSYIIFGGKGGTEKEVANCFQFKTPFAEFQANAKLIAVAPDLLEALKLCVEKLKEYANDDDLAAGNGYGIQLNPQAFISEAVELAEQAIAKVEGVSA